MTQLRLDDMVAAKLRNLSEPVELIDETGRVVARAYPAVNPSEYEPCEPPFTEEELRKSEQSNKWFTTEQVLAHLRSLEQQ
jgi:hypothetical protein